MCELGRNALNTATNFSRHEHRIALRLEVACEFFAVRGRGLYLMQSLTDELFYLRGSGQNVLVLRRARPASAQEIFPDSAQLQQRLADAETAM